MNAFRRRGESSHLLHPAIQQQQHNNHCISYEFTPSIFEGGATEVMADPLMVKGKGQ